MNFEEYMQKRKEFDKQFTKRLEPENKEQLITHFLLAKSLPEALTKDQKVSFEVKDGQPMIEINTSVIGAAIAAVEIMYSSQQFERCLDYFMSYLQMRQLGFVREESSFRKFNSKEELEVFKKIFNSSEEMKEDLKKQMEKAKE